MKIDIQTIKKDTHFIDFIDSRDLRESTIKHYAKRLTTFCNLIGKTPTELIEEAEETLSTYLAGLNLNAKDKDHIKKWWSKPEMIKTEYGFVPVYDIEHPKGLKI